MALTYTQTDTGNGCTPVGKICSVGGSAGSTPQSVSLASSGFATLLLELDTTNHTRDNGSWTVRLNVTTANMNLQVDTASVGIKNSCSSVTTYGGDGVPQSLGSTGVKSWTFSTSGIPASGTVVVSFLISNGAMSTQAFSYTPNQNIDSPFTAPANVSITSGLGQLTITGRTPTVFLLDPKAVTTGLGQLAITGHAPTLAVSDNVNISASLGQLTLTGHAPTPVATANVFITAGLGALTITGYEPTVSKHIQTGLGALTITGHVPTVAIGSSISISAGLGALLLTGHAPAIAKTENTFITPNAGALTITGLQPTVQTTAHVAVNTQTGALVITGYQPSVSADASVAITAALGQLMLSGHIPSVDVSGQESPVSTSGGGRYRYFTPQESRTCREEFRALEKKKEVIERKIVRVEKKLDDEKERARYRENLKALQVLIDQLAEIQKQFEAMQQRMWEVEDDEIALVTLICERFR